MKDMINMSIKKNMKGIQLKENFIKSFFFVCGIFCIIVLTGIFLLLVVQALPAFEEIDIFDFLFNRIWNPTSPSGGKYGILSMVLSTAMVAVGAMVFSIPLGIGMAIYLSDIASSRVREIAKPIVEILAGIPSVVIGFIGLVVMSPIIGDLFGLSNGLNALNGSILLGVMALPTITSISEDALKAVPISYEHASLALGASKWETIIKVKVPAAVSGIFAACMLGMGRAIGETMTVLMVTGCSLATPESFLDPVRTMTATIAIELGEVPYDTTHFFALFAVGLVLFIITFIVNLVADLVINKKKY